MATLGAGVFVTILDAVLGSPLLPGEQVKVDCDQAYQLPWPL